MAGSIPNVTDSVEATDPGPGQMISTAAFVITALGSILHTEVMGLDKVMRMTFTGIPGRAYFGSKYYDLYEHILVYFSSQSTKMCGKNEVISVHPKTHSFYLYPGEVLIVKNHELSGQQTADLTVQLLVNSGDTEEETPEDPPGTDYDTIEPMSFVPYLD